jgi:hypothetical protein
VKGLLAPTLVMLPLLSGGIATEAATAATNNALGNPGSQAPIVMVEEACGNGYFRDINGCRPWYGPVTTANAPHEQCPWGWHFVHWANHRGGFCKSDF